MTPSRTEQLIERLHDPSTAEATKAGAIRELAAVWSPMAQKAVESQLSSSSPILRYDALEVLVLHRGLSEHRDTALRFLLEDPDEDNRRLGAACLGRLLYGSHDGFALQTLLKVFLNEGERFTVRSGAYFAMLDILGEPQEKHRVSLKPERFEQQIDWGIIASLKERFGI